MHGILILLASLIGAPIFLFVAPILTTAAAAAGGTAAVGSSAAMQDPSSSDESSVSTNGSREPNQVGSEGMSNGGQDSLPGMGDVVEFEDSEWVILDARELGSELRAEKGFLEETATTPGRFVYVRYRVTNKTNEEQQVLFTPALVDSKGRRFEELAQSEFFLPDGETGLTLESLPSSLPRTIGAIFEVASDADGLKFMCRNFEPEFLGKKEKAVRIEPKAQEQEPKNGSGTDSTKRVEEELGEAIVGALLESATTEDDAAESPEERLAELKGELAEVNATIESERRRWQQALDTINRLTNFKTRPVVEGSPQYHQCLAASKVIQEVEEGAPELKAKKARLEAVIEELEK